MTIPFNREFLYLVNIPYERWNNKDTRLLLFLLAASKKVITRKWLKPEPPTVKEWTDIIHNIYVMERHYFALKTKMDDVFSIWSKWIDYIEPICGIFL